MCLCGVSKDDWNVGQQTEGWRPILIMGGTIPTGLQPGGMKAGKKEEVAWFEKLHSAFLSRCDFAITIAYDISLWFLQSFNVDSH